MLVGFFMYNDKSPQKAKTFFHHKPKFISPNFLTYQTFLIHKKYWLVITLIF